jgi:cell division protein ZipA
MDNLRLTLLIIGCLVVLCIYLWEVFYKNIASKKTDLLNAVDESPDVITPSINNNEADDYSAALADLGSLLTESRNQGVRFDDHPAPVNVSESVTNNDEPDEELPLEMSVKDYEASLSNENAIIENKEEIYSEDDYENNPVEADEEDEHEKNVPESNQNSEDLLVLYITSPTHTLFNGLSISKAADEVGMVYGHMNIFHHFGPGKLHSGQPLFSIANMHEPGSFDLGKMADLKTKGIAAFMYSPASIDASVVFELFLNTTQRIAELLGGEIRTSDNKVLNSAAISSLREKAESL